ncbi:hypothetical protein IMG5_002140 [Ichthyophthirius multifiliis]|uniref:Uncharacterized protein n=1 Tax=Ichthyophthirius multifiliis TaxID=5932 RepID=G0QJ26_ICHMU|nr:hypothetical protein IMG5_002140 [Ichthyophthirius multifiliis]EGR34779.1 hypothetical protein IMG5_002140 [Ichthyophthirius multifiliis]|eukprot:XP_004040083.1 hypothetical protein IMG5_002140 [Ichthyophthirius multifiliis]
MCIQCILSHSGHNFVKQQYSIYLLRRKVRQSKHKIKQFFQLYLKYQIKYNQKIITFIITQKMLKLKNKRHFLTKRKSITKIFIYIMRIIKNSILFIYNSNDINFKSK